MTEEKKPRKKSRNVKPETHESKPFATLGDLLRMKGQHTQPSDNDSKR